jgi:peptide-methionine (R)-S-oxide reductase
MSKKNFIRSENEWKKLLKPEVYKILRKKHTEPAFTGKFLYNKKEGTYVCAGCKNPLFSSKTKFDSGSGWPSFWDIISKANVEIEISFELNCFNRIKFSNI